MLLYFNLKKCILKRRRNKGSESLRNFPRNTGCYRAGIQECIYHDDFNLKFLPWYLCLTILLVVGYCSGLDVGSQQLACDTNQC